MNPRREIIPFISPVSVYIPPISEAAVYRKRVLKPGVFKKSPFVAEFESGASMKEEVEPAKSVGMSKEAVQASESSSLPYPFDENVESGPNYKDVCDFNNWIDEGLLKRKNKKK